MALFPGIAGEIEALIGQELTTRLLRHWGGCQINIPKHARGSKLAEVIGAEAAERVIREIGHGRITLPCGSMRGTKRRRSEAMRMLRAGASLQQVALACDLHTRTVSNYRAALDAEAGHRQMTLPFDRD
ncbi:hypothetical protein RSWS8N_18104 [Cereibacter sphaeroides WS8N]|uniref:helix-turn-helix domain-containing protein n=1 Tax=Cereibacter sphaeroides TaxID=1063 RepID=UPI00020B0324|nr:helix-turn-helix domain-containing protein [Cereibacter sphaeroides]EGJ20099.1 hypothetical protein RSWS8N_18104 [Cereibacter sphaeroides WS8N]